MYSQVGPTLLEKDDHIGYQVGNNLTDHQLGISYRELEIVEYADSSYAGNLEHKKSITGYCFFFNGTIVI